MKKFKLLALTALLALGTNAFATDVYIGANKHVYKYDGTVDDKGVVTNGFTFVGVGDATITEVNIPATLTYTDPKTGKTISGKVVAISTTWAGTAVTGETQVLEGSKLTTMTIAIDNITSFAATAYNQDKIKSSLTSLTITDAKEKSTQTTSTVFSDLTKLITLNLVGTQYTTIAEKACLNLEKLTTVNLPATLTTIEKSAFNGCKILETAEIPAAVTTIGDYAFQNTAKYVPTFSALTKLESIGNGAFNKAAVATADLSATKITNIGYSAFLDCDKLISVSLPESLKNIGNSAFSGSKISTVAIPDKVTSIGTAFSGIADLETITGMKGLSNLDADAFKGDEKLTAIDLSANKGIAAGTTLGAAFGGCKALATVKLPENVQTLPADLFKDCALVTFEGPGVKKMSNNSTFPAASESKPNTKLETLVLGDLTITLEGFAYYTALKSVTLGTITGTGGIKKDAFKGCTALTDLTITEANIKGYAFDGCTALKTVTMTDGTVQDNAFYGCTALTAFNLLDPQNPGTNYIKDEAFLACTPWITITTTATYMAAQPTAPKNAKYATSESSIIKTVRDNGTSGKFFGKFENNDPTNRDAIFEVTAGMKLYSVYVDGENAIFSALRTYDSNKKYYVPAGAHVIIKSDEAIEVPYTFDNIGSNSIAYDDIYSKNHEPMPWAAPAAADVASLAAFQAKYVGAGEYVYALTNGTNGGFGFTFYAGTKISDTGFYVITEKRPAEAGARLNTIWLDENGNPEGEATAIESVKNIANDGVIYNMAGQKVDANYKGIVIKNGKKMIQK